MKSKDHVAAMVRTLAENGVHEYSIDWRRRHPRLLFDWRGARKIYTFPASGSDWRGPRKAAADLRRMMRQPAEARP